MDPLTSVYLVLFIKRISDSTDLVKFKQLPTAPVGLDTNNLSIFLVKSIVAEFRAHCQVAQRNLLVAALQKPVYGPLGAIRNLVIHSLDE
jgi:hypothetical protein